MREQIIRDNRSNAFKVIIGSVIGIFAFFIPLPTQSGKAEILLVSLIDHIKEAFGNSLEYVTLGVIALLCLSWVGSRITSSSRLRALHREDGPVVGSLYILALFFALLLVLQIGPGWLLDEDVGGLALHLGGSVLLTVSIAGFFVVFLTEFGLAEFVGTLMEPLMRPLYRAPGRSAIDAVTSFVASPAVGVYITNTFYKQGGYTAREAAFVASSFSVVSIGFFALLASIGGILDYLPHLIVTTFIITFIVGIIMCRIPPVSWKKNEYFDGTAQQQRSNERVAVEGTLMGRAWGAAIERASSAGTDSIIQGLWGAILFALKIVCYVLAIATPALVIAHYTPVFDYLGVPFIPLLSALQLPDVAQIAPAIPVGIAEVSLPTIVISGTQASTAAVFFVCTLSTLQIIFFTGSANAILESDIPLNMWEIVLIFVLRTIISIPFVALATHLLF